jgi:hypothetical protein
MRRQATRALLVVASLTAFVAVVGAGWKWF